MTNRARRGSEEATEMLRSAHRGHRGVRESCRRGSRGASRRPPGAFENQMHPCASFDAAKDERTNIKAEAIVTCNRASKYTRAKGKFKNLPESNRARLKARGRPGDCLERSSVERHQTCHNESAQLHAACKQQDIQNKK